MNTHINDGASRFDPVGLYHVCSSNGGYNNISLLYHAFKLFVWEWTMVIVAFLYKGSITSSIPMRMNLPHTTAFFPSMSMPWPSLIWSRSLIHPWGVHVTSKVSLTVAAWVAAEKSFAILAQCSPPMSFWSQHCLHHFMLRGKKVK